jgi:hypothetical protein
MGMYAWDLETFQNSVLKSAKIRRCRKKSPAKFRQKLKKNFLGHEFFLLFQLKLQYFVQESAAKFTIFFIFCKKKFFENLVFLTDTVADLAVRYTLCGAILCAPTVHFFTGAGNFSTDREESVNLYISFLDITTCCRLHHPPWLALWSPKQRGGSLHRPLLLKPSQPLQPLSCPFFIVSGFLEDH